MNKFLTIFMVLVMGAAISVQAAEKIVFVDLEQLFTLYYKTELAQNQIKEQAADIKYERENMEEEIVELRSEVERLRAEARDEVFTEEVRESKRNQFEEKLVKMQSLNQELVQYEKLRTEQLEQQKARMSRKLFDEIHEAITTYAREKGYVAVIDRSSQSRAATQVVMYVDRQYDITAELLVVLNAGQKKAAESAPITTEVKGE